ncbi:uncharacterized protein BDV14DRAFT_206227 [Aspergillus stella-maris]|uniref:uncharacterized protein n=1 Tax=Aspergillus stella-maris TaxID=1810926 RepID=UPI003CCCA3D0
MHFLRPLITTISITFLTRPAIAAVTASSLFETIPTGTDGNCDDKDIDTMVQEAITLNNAAIKALNTLTQDKLLSTSGEEGRLGELATAMWGVQMDRPTIYFNYKYRFDEEDRGVLSTVKGEFLDTGYFDQVNEKLLSGTNSDKGKLVCGGEDWTYASTYEDLGFSEEDGLTGNLDQDLYISNYWSPKDAAGKFQFQEGKIIATHQERNGVSLGGKSLCDPPGKAQTWAKSKLVMMCDQCFDQSTLVDLYAAQDSWASGKHIDTVITAGSEFQHEMFHYIDEGITDKTVDGVAGYGWANTAAIADAQFGPLQNADNYRVFATAVFFDRVKWDADGTKE